jgi:predicted O-linked N-acetylglucosamine transferase (SPINDLY family)
MIAEEQSRWNRQFGDPLKRWILPHANDRDPERRLRVGYVSPAFCDHVVGRNIVPLIERHDRERFEVFCYSGVVHPDHMTERFRTLADEWRSTVGLSDAKVAEMIRQDEVDILVDLSQHMGGNRLAVFARRPAPVQVSFAGYPESTGLEAIGYRISDRYLERNSVDDVTRQTDRVFLIDSFWCYDPCGINVEVNSLPADETGTLTFGNLNNFCKINEAVLQLWARVLRAVKHSRLILLSPPGSHRERTLAMLRNEGVESHRVEFFDQRPREEYLELYHRLDMVLDTFPYNGHTTSLDALWMGVPVVTLAGKTAVGRAGLSQAMNLGLPELIARTAEQFEQMAVDLASDLHRLAELRLSLRQRMQSSPLMDAALFTRNTEAAYRDMWQRWCRESNSSPR